MKISVPIAGLAAACLVAGLALSQGIAQEPRNLPTAARSIPVRTMTSPVDTFRQLIAMTPSERALFLTNYSAAARERIFQKIDEYAILPEPLGELRLQVTELRWYLLPLLRNPPDPTNRTARLAMVPERYRGIIEARLDEWYILPPTLKAEVLEYETTMHYFVGRGAVVQPQMRVDDVPSAQRNQVERKLNRWQALPLEQRQQMYGTFEHIFELSEAEKDRILQTLPPPERAETARALQPIERLPRPEQERYMAALRQFANMSADERHQFMRGAQRWQRMSETERQAWRDLVQQLADTPPYPTGFVPPSRSTAPAPPLLPIRTNPTTAPSP